MVIPVRDMAMQLQRCLDVLLDQAAPPRFQVVVVDDCSADGSADVAARHELHPVVRRLRHPLGSYAARNCGAHATTAAWLAFLDADCIPDSNWARIGVEAVRQFGIVGGAVEITATASPSRWELYDRAMNLDQRTHVRRQSFAATANLWVSADVWRSVGEFAPLVSGGDLEWGRRASDAGYRIEYVEECRVRHPPRTNASETWRLHRRLGSGWAHLAERGLSPPMLSDPALRTRLSYVRQQCESRGVPATSRALVVPHVVATAARIVGRATGRP